jgi:hypothetical protein
MSSPLAIGAVSAVLRNLLDNGLIETGPVGAPVSVSAVAPDTIDLEAAGQPRLNLFLYKVTPNPGWRNHGLPSRSSADGGRLSNPPLALDLHYMLTAYSRADCEAEILLGYGMHLLHERPVLDRAAIRRALDPSPLDVSMLPTPFQALAASDLADQVEQIKITHAVFGSDDMSKLWSALQTHYRPSAAYEVSVVLIESRRPAVTPLPVLTRGRPIPGTQRDEGVAVSPDVLPPLPTLFEARPEDKQPAARLGEVVTILGIRLAGTGHGVRLFHPLFASPQIIAPDSVSADGRTVKLTLPNSALAQAALVAGQLSATIRFTPAGAPGPRDTNAIPLVIAPAPAIAADVPLGLPAATAVRIAGPGARVEVTLASRPQVRPTQQAVLMLDGAEAVAAPRTAPADPLVFKFPASLPNGTYWVRLRVDGTESLLVDRTDPVPVFDTSQRIVVT